VISVEVNRQIFEFKRGKLDEPGACSSSTNEAPAREEHRSLKLALTLLLITRTFTSIAPLSISSRIEECWERVDLDGVVKLDLDQVDNPFHFLRPRIIPKVK
jgi:hypothetical protein